MHKPHGVLEEELKKAASKVKVGKLYYHYKNPDATYKVLRLAITESDDTVCVVYEAQYDKRLVFVRPLRSWLGTVQLGDAVVQRFTLKKEA
jgi:hypothetical protein